MGPYKILIFGLPGAGKTTLAEQLKKELCNFNVEHFNADYIRQLHNDWDFSDQGRVRQAIRMRDYANSSTANIVICDFVAPKEKYRNIFNPDLSVFVDTIEEGRFEDTNKIFERSYDSHIHVYRKDCEFYSKAIISFIRKHSEILD